MKNNLIKKPISLWGIQVILLGPIIYGLYKIIQMTIFIVNPNVIPEYQLITSYIYGIIAFCVLLFIFIGIQMKNKAARWLALLTACFTFFIIISGLIHPSSNIEIFKLNSPSEKLGALIANIIILILISASIYKIIFGKKVKSYFNPRKSSP